MTPTFDEDATSYTANITDATSTLTVTAESTGAVITTKLNDVTFTGTTITWTSNTDVLSIIVTCAGKSKTYTVTVTHTT